MTELIETGSHDPRWPAAIEALLRCSTVGAAAREIGIGERTLYRWLTFPEFAAEYQRARRKVVLDTVGRLQTLTSKAADTLERNLNCENPSIEIRAAVAILNQTFRGTEIAEFDARLCELEFNLKEQQRANDSP